MMNMENMMDSAAKFNTNSVRSKINLPSDLVKNALQNHTRMKTHITSTPGIRTLLVTLAATTLPSAHVQRAFPVYISAILF